LANACLLGTTKLSKRRSLSFYTSAIDKLRLLLTDLETIFPAASLRLIYLEVGSNLGHDL